MNSDRGESSKGYGVNIVPKGGGRCEQHALLSCDIWFSEGDFQEMARILGKQLSGMSNMGSFFSHIKHIWQLLGSPEHHWQELVL